MLLIRIFHASKSVPAQSRQGQRRRIHAVTNAPKRAPRVPIPETRWPTANEAERSVLFSPLKVGNVRLRTRTWIPAMVPWRSNEDGFATPDVLDWYARFADGRPGAIVVEATGIRDIPSGPLLRISDQRFENGLRDLVRVVRERSDGETRLFLQIIDFLAIRRRPPKDKFVRRFLEITPELRAGIEGSSEAGAASASDDDMREALLRLTHDELLSLLPPRAARDLEHGYRETVNDEHLPHIAELPRVLPALFADAAERAQRVGFDGVELHFAHAYTMASFLSRTNMRTDGYGGAREARVRLPLEVFAAVRARVGDDYAVGCRFLGDEVIDGGSRIEDATFYGRRFAEAGMDFLSLSKGGKFDDAKQPKVGQAAYPYTGPSGHECMPTVRVEGGPFGRNLPLSAAVRSAVREAGHGTPIVGCGGINSFELAEKALADGDCDLVGAARQSLADPDWFLKIERGHGAEIRRCIYTNYCEALDQKHVEVTCQLWDRQFGDAEDAEIKLTADGKRRLLAPVWKTTD